jgi:pimeloyl-ACP methyl ester carboxylesterase
VRGLITAATVALIFYGAVCAALYLAQGRLLYLPTPDVNPPGATALRLVVGDASLKIWQLHPHARPALIYFGGNAEDAAASLSDFDTEFPDRAVYVVNYRSYGGSTGRPSEAALVSDAHALYDWVTAHHDPVAVVGRSLGSGVATALAADRPIERLILVTPCDSIANVAAEHLFWIPVRWLLKDQYDSLQRIGKVRAPVLAVVAERDEVVSRARSKALIRGIPSTLRHTLVIPHANHNDISALPGYFPALREFLAGRVADQ